MWPTPYDKWYGEPVDLSWSWQGEDSVWEMVVEGLNTDCETCVAK